MVVSVLTPMEIAAGVVTGGVGTADRILPGPDVQPVTALERAMSSALRRPPCLVSFSGGLDSSLVLARADLLARREGLPRPIPVSLRFRDAPAAVESRAQESVVRALGCPDWQRHEIEDEADLVGPYATRALRRHGLMYPANAYLHLPLLDLAGGGALLTGIGGDQVLGGWRTAPRRRRPWWWPGRGAVGGRPAPRFEWLRPAAAHRARRSIARERAGQPRSFDRRVVWHAARRDLVLSLQTLQMLASETDTLVLSPLTDPEFAAAVAAAGGPRGFGPAGIATRRATVRALFGDLPESVTAPRRKATFQEVFWRRPTHELMRSWNGEGVEPTLVDVDALRTAWSRPDPPRLTALLVHQVWMATRGGRREVA